jgi:hypothetical protein
MSGLRPIAGSDHTIEPVKDSWYTQGGLRANLFRPDHYPIQAVCSVCSRPILAKSFLQDWMHFSRD